MCKLVECGVEMVKKLNPNESPYNPTLFIQRLLQNYVTGVSTDAEVGDTDTPGGLDVTANAESSFRWLQGLNPNAFNWVDLGKVAIQNFCTVPLMSHMLGPLDIVPKPKQQKQRKKRVRAELGSLVNPDEVVANDQQPSQQTDKNMEVMHKVLKQRTKEKKPTTMAHLVYNPDSFAQTIENIFTLAFLVRDGRASLKRTDNKLFVTACKVPDASDWAQQIAVVSQFCLRFSMKEWREEGQGLQNEIDLSVEKSLGLIPSRERVLVPERAIGMRGDEEGEAQQQKKQKRKSCAPNQTAFNFAAQQSTLTTIFASDVSMKTVFR